MKTTFVDFTATDGVKLQGLLFEPAKRCKTIIVHIHGMAGSFYENTFIPIMAKYYSDNDLAFLAFNNRGHDYIADIVKFTPEGCEYILGGAAYETIEESIFDIEGAMSFVEELGYERIILQGHSSGANKIVFSYSRKPLDAIGVILLSPCDDIGLHIDEVGDKRYEFMQLANTLVNNGTPDALMPENTYFSYLLSARTYKECFYEGSVLDAFPYRDDSAEFSMFGKVTAPLFVTFGTDGDYLLQSPETAQKMLMQKKSSRATLKFEVIEGASHSYTGKEAVLAEKIIEWIKGLNG